MDTRSMLSDDFGFTLLVCRQGDDVVASVGALAPYMEAPHVNFLRLTYISPRYLLSSLSRLADSARKAISLFMLWDSALAAHRRNNNRRGETEPQPETAMYQLCPLCRSEDVICLSWHDTNEVVTFLRSCTERP